MRYKSCWVGFREVGVSEPGENGSLRAGRVRGDSKRMVGVLGSAGQRPEPGSPAADGLG